MAFRRGEDNRSANGGLLSRLNPVLPAKRITRGIAQLAAIALERLLEELQRASRQNQTRCDDIP
jgi:hypothetical protein